MCRNRILNDNIFCIGVGVQMKQALFDNISYEFDSDQRLNSLKFIMEFEIKSIIIVWSENFYII